MFKFLHAADIHLDSPLSGLERFEDAPVAVIRSATRRALENLVELALAERVNFVVIAGDVYDGDWPDVHTGLFFGRQMSRLTHAGIRVFLISGNHDAANRINRSLPLPPGIARFPNDRPATEIIDELGVAIHGQGFATADVRTNLAITYPNPLSDHFNIGMLHTAATGREGHESYAPCTVEDLIDKGYEYWALGHIHQREILCREPWIVFPGNIQGRHIRETGSKGCVIVTVGDRGRAEVSFRPLDVLRWERCEVDASGLAGTDEVLCAFSQRLDELLTAANGQPVAARVVLHGRTAIHHRLVSRQSEFAHEIRATALQSQPAGELWIEKVVVQTQPEATIGERDGSFDELDEYLSHAVNDEAELKVLADELSDLCKKLPAELMGEDGIVPSDEKWLRLRLAEVRSLLVNKFSKDGEDA